MAQYSNTLGIIVANGAMSTIYSTSLAPMIKTVIRDVKKYMATANDITGQRQLPIGYSASTGRLILRTTFDYFTAGKEDETVDFFCVSYLPAARRSQSWLQLVSRTAWLTCRVVSMQTSTGAASRPCTSPGTSRSSRPLTTRTSPSSSPSTAATWARAASASSRRRRPSTRRP